MNLSPQNNIQIFQNTEALAKAAADLMIEISKQSIEKNGRFVISLSGGSTPEYLFKLLAKPPYLNQITWDKTFVFWGDERFVPSDDHRNNSNRAKSLLLNHVPIPAINIHPIPVDLKPEESTKEYEKTIKKLFDKESPCFDLIFLGLGEDGHTASLFPKTDVVFENKKLVKEVYVDEQNMYRITMTPALINQANNIIFLVEGEKKAEIIKTILTEPIEPNQFPAQIIHPENGNLYLYLDKKAASQLPSNIQKNI
jgi:6-phosphogluconolactonase